jgi:hypothetical protein
MVFMFDHTKTTQNTEHQLKAVLSSEGSPWTCPNVALILLMCTTYGMRNNVMDLENWDKCPVLIDFKTGLPLTDVQHRECVTKRQKSAGIYKFMGKVRTHQWRKYMTQSWLAAGGCGQVLARANNWGKTGDGASMTEQDTYQIGIEEPWTKHGAGTPLGEPYYCPGMQHMALVEADSNAQELVVAIANCCVGRNLEATFWANHTDPPESGTYEKGRSLKSTLHMILWGSSVVVARLNQMHDEEPKHWFFRSARSPAGFKSTLELPQILWREAQNEPHKIYMQTWINMGKGKSMSTDDGTKLYSMLSKQEQKQTEQHKLVVDLLKNVLQQQQPGGGRGGVEGGLQPTGQATGQASGQQRMLHQLQSLAPVGGGISAGSTMEQLNDPSQYDTRKNGKATWEESRAGTKRTYQGYVPLFNLEVLTLREIDTWTRALALYTCDTTERKSFSWLESNSKWWRFKVSPQFSNRFMRWVKAVHLIEVLAREEKKTPTQIASLLDSGDPGITGADRGDYPPSLPGQADLLLTNVKPKVGKYYTLQKEYTQAKTKEAKAAKAAACKRPTSITASPSPITLLTLGPQLPPSQMSLLGQLSPSTPPQAKPWVPPSKREGYHRVWAKEVGTMDMPAVDKELSSYKSVAGVEIAVPEGAILASFLGENVGEKRKRAQLVLTREFVSKRNVELPWKKKKT